MDTHLRWLCWAICSTSNTLKCLELRLKLMCIDKTKSIKTIYPKKLAGKVKHQKLDKQKFTGKKKKMEKGVWVVKIVYRDGGDVFLWYKWCIEVMLMGKGYRGRWSRMFTILIISIFFKGCYLLLLGLSDKESVIVSVFIHVRVSRK